MRLMLKLVAVFLVLAVVGVGVAVYAMGPSVFWAYVSGAKKSAYRESDVDRGDVGLVVSSTGTVQPIRRVQVGCFASGPIQKLFVTYNSEVHKGDPMAKIDPRIQMSSVARDRATCATAEAEVKRATALLEQAKADEVRAKALRSANKDYLSDTEMDRFKFNRMSQEAQLAVAEASREQAKATLNNSETNLEYTDVRSPVDGVVIDVKVEEGQTLVAQFQVPEMFVLAPEMEKRMHVFASVDEADIGLIREAKEANRPVAFFVDAYQDVSFEGHIWQIRINPTVTQNVVTYTVVVEAPNPGRKLLPGMTANLSFSVKTHPNVLRVPNAALRFYPTKAEQVRPEDRKILQGIAADVENRPKDDEQATEAKKGPEVVNSPAVQERHVWVVDGAKLRAVPLHVGLSDNTHTEVTSGELAVGDKVVTGVAVDDTK